MRLWKINTMPNPSAADQTPDRVTPDAEQTLDRISEYLNRQGNLSLPEYMAPGQPPMDVSVGKNGRWAGAYGALFTWHDSSGNLWRGWVLEDGSIGRVEEDVIDVDSDDPSEIESHWEPRYRVQAQLRVAAGMQARPFM